MIILWIILIYVGICILINGICWIASKISSARLDARLRRNYPPAVTYRPIERKPEIPNCLTYKENGKEYKARFENGRVYWITDYNKEVYIGKYALENNRWIVRCASDDGEIAKIDKDGISALIYLSRTGDLARYRKILMNIAKEDSVLNKQELERQYNEALRRTKLIRLCAEACSCIIMDIDTNDTIAYSTSGDVVGNAATFACIQYDVLLEGRYRDFFKPIN